MGAIATKVARPVRKFNIENRAARALDRQQKTGQAAPKHPSTLGHIENIKQDYPEAIQIQSEKHETLNENLKKVYVESFDKPIETASSSRPLPVSREAVKDTDLGVMDTEHTIPEGKANLKTLLTVIGQHQVNPEAVTPEGIAQEHKLDVEQVRNVLSHFRALQLHVPETMLKENKKLKDGVRMQINSFSGDASQFKVSGSEKQKSLGESKGGTAADISPSKT